MFLYVILYVFGISFLFTGILFFLNGASLYKRYNKQYDNIYADVEDIEKGGKK